MGMRTWSDTSRVPTAFGNIEAFSDGLDGIVRPAVPALVYSTRDNLFSRDVKKNGDTGNVRCRNDSGLTRFPNTEISLTQAKS